MAKGRIAINTEQKAPGSRFRGTSPGLGPQSLFPPRFLHKPSLKTAAISKPFISTDREVEVAGGMAGKILRKGPGWPQAKVEPFQPTKAAFMS